MVADIHADRMVADEVHCYEVMAVKSMLIMSMFAFALSLAPRTHAAAVDYAVQPASTLGFHGTFQGSGFDGTFAR